MLKNGDFGPKCVVPENIYTPPPQKKKDWKFWGVGGGSKAQEFLEGGEGVVSMNFVFFQTGFNFHTVVCKVSLFAFCFSSSKQEKKNLANLKLLVRLDILLPVESEKQLVLKRMLWKVDKLIMPDGKYVCRT